MESGGGGDLKVVFLLLVGDFFFFFFFEFWGDLILKTMATLCLFFWRLE